MGVGTVEGVELVGVFEPLPLLVIEPAVVWTPAAGDWLTGVGGLNPAGLAVICCIIGDSRLVRGEALGDGTAGGKYGLWGKPL